MAPGSRHLRIDIASYATLALTVILFVIALFEKGLTHDILLEAGVFLVSMKLVLGAHKTQLMDQAIQEKLDEVLEKLREKAP